MPRRATILLAAALIALVGALAAAAPRPPTAAARGTPRPGRGDPTAFPHAADRVLVRFADDTAPALRNRAHAARRAAVRRRSRSVPGLDVVSLPPGTTVADALAAYAREPGVLYVEPDYQVRAEAIPNDPRFGELWGLHNTGQIGRYVGTPDADIDAPEAWEITTGSAGVVVAVLDTGTDLTHPDLVPNLFRNTPDCNLNGVDDDGNGWVDDCFGIDTYNGDSRPLDDHGHGTHVAGTIGAAGDDGIGVVGVSPNVTILSCKFLNNRGEGFTSDAVACFDYVAVMKSRGVGVVATNNSWGGGGFSTALLEAIETQRDLGILTVASAGNSGLDLDAFPQFPASFYAANVVAVAATRRQDLRSVFSNHGRRSAHLGAPGEEILSTYLGSAYRELQGTSMAAPHVTGTLALLAAQAPGRAWWENRNLLLAGGDPKPDLASTITGRRLNARGALACAGVTLRTRLRPVPDEMTAPVGLPLDLSALHVTCGSPAGDLDVTIAPSGATIPLRDDGIDFDQVAGDGIYSARWVPDTPGVYALTFAPGDVLTVTATRDALHAGTAFPAARFGYAVARAGNVLAVGAPGDSTAAPGAGAVYVHDATTRAPLFTLTAPDAAAGDEFGFAVAAVGDDLLVGAPYKDVGGAEDAGGAYLFDGATGAFLRTLDDPVPLESDLFGFAVAGVSGTAAVGAPWADDLVAPDLGAVHLFDPATGANLRTLRNPSSASLTLGWALAPLGPNLIVGAPGGSAVPQAAHLFDADPASPGYGTILRSFPTPATTPEIALTLFFGSVVLGLDDRVVIGDPIALVRGEPNLLSGAAFVFDAGSGALLDVVTDPQPDNGGRFATSMARLGDGLAIGSPETDFVVGEGAVYRFTPAGELLQVLRPPLPGANSDLGAAVASLGDAVVAGAPLDDAVGIDAGAAYFLTPSPRHRVRCYKAVPRGTGFAPTDVPVADAIESTQTLVRRPSSVCVAVSQDGSAVEDAAARLACYDAQDASGEPAFVRQDVTVVNVFGRQRLALKKTASLCLASGVDGGPVVPSLNHYKCYRATMARGETRFARRDVAVADEFASGAVRVLRPAALCVPAAVDGSAVVDAEHYLACYKARDTVRVASRDVVVDNALATHTVGALKGAALCVPSTRF
jgi:subtilisin family serine protease